MTPPRTVTRKRRYPVWGLLMMLLISAVGLACLYLLRNPARLVTGEVSLITFGFVGCWRWSWFGFQVLRGRIYQHFVFPRWRRRANQMPLEALPPVCFLVPTYYEKPWITERVFRAIAREAKTLSQPMTLLVNSGSDEENATIAAILRAEDPEMQSMRLIQMVQGGEGKRKAMADGLRTLAALGLPRDTIVALMDGDSELSPGTLKRCLPFFRLFPRLGALTTDELPIVEGSYWFSEWFHLRMAQRNYHMCSVSLGQKVTCLTGRFSLFCSEGAFDSSFAAQLEHDSLNDWLWGNFKFLSGDDKSTWYWLLKRGYDMIYVPDVIVYSIETISGSLVRRAYQNMRRWYGNMLRNSGRAIALGPKKTGWFTWLVLVDQKISIWIPLITPGLFLIALLQEHWIGAGIIAAWVLFSRPLVLMLFFINLRGRQSYLKPIHLPMLLVSQWSACLVKIWTQMNLAQQKWANRGSQSISATGRGWVKLTKLSTSRFLYATSLFSFVLILFVLAGTVNPIKDLAILSWESSAAANSNPTVIESIDYGVKADDGKDDAVQLQALINRLPPQEMVQINLPIGEISLFQPLVIHRSNLLIHGQGVDRTILQAYFDRPSPTAILSAYPSAKTPWTQPNFFQQSLRNISLQDFTLRRVATSAPPTHSSIDGITLQQVAHGFISRIRFESSIRKAIVLNQTKDVNVEYVAIDNGETQSPSPHATVSSQNE